MWLRRLRLVDFRNIAELDHEFRPGVNLILGDNAQGKTNLLEAIYLLALARPLRGDREGELVRWERPLGHVEGTLERSAGEVEVGVTLTRADVSPRLLADSFGDRPWGGGDGGSGAVATLPAEAGRVTKRLTLGGRPRRPQEFVGTLRMVLFWPEDLRMVAGPPALRRRLLDTMLSQQESRYRTALSRYARILEHRNATLRALAEGTTAAHALEPWNQQLVSEGALLTHRRAAAVARLREVARSRYTVICGGAEMLDLQYVASLARPNADGSAATPPSEFENWSAEEWESAFRARLRQRAQAELARGTTLVGPHRDDLALALDGRPAATFGSQGQQRSVALAVKLAEARFLEEAGGDPPLLLLDDVMSELDGRRRAMLMEALADVSQTFITAAESGYFTPALLASAHRRRMRGGHLEDDE